MLQEEIEKLSPTAQNLMKSKLNVGMRNVSDKEEKNNPDRSSTMMHYSPEILDVDLVLITVTANSAANSVCF